MSDLDDLIAAAGTRPTAGLLRILVALARQNGTSEAAAAYLGTLDAEAYDLALREAVASFLLKTAPAAALTWSVGQDGTLAILHARALLALGREPEAREGYIATLALFPQLRDASLDARFAAVQGHAASGTNGSNIVPLDRQQRRGGHESETELGLPRERIDFDSIGGLDAVKVQIRRRIILPFERKGLFERFRKRAGGGVLLYGPPGCGKTLIARATATECGASFTAVEITDVLEKWLGDSEKRIAALFAGARAKRPAVLFFDEVEALAARRRFSDHSYQSSMVSTFLSEMDGFRGDNDGVLVLAATNTPWAMDSAFRRPGRFDRSLFIPPPDRASREAILGIALRGRPADQRLPLGEIADKTGGFSGADLADLVETACDAAIERSIAGDTVAPITAADLRTAFKSSRPTTAAWLTQARNYAKFANEGGYYDDVLAFLDAHGR